jgi:hypothetical protein
VLVFDGVEPRRWGDSPRLAVHRFIGRGYTALADYHDPSGILVLRVGKADGDKVLFWNGLARAGLADYLRDVTHRRFRRELAWVDWDAQVRLFRSCMPGAVTEAA